MGNTIDQGLYLSSLQNDAKTRTHSNKLGQDAFLKILITQLQNQDPMSPMQDTEFISQMATFSELEQMIAVNDQLKQLTRLQTNQQIIQYNHLLGKNVDWQKIIYDEENEDATPIVEKGTGQIVAIQLSGDTAIFTLADGTKVEPSEIKGLSNIASDNDFLVASHVIGKQISWQEGENVLQGIVTSISQKLDKSTLILTVENN